jgi:hypothetical protein
MVLESPFIQCYLLAKWNLSPNIIAINTLRFRFSFGFVLLLVSVYRSFVRLFVSLFVCLKSGGTKTFENGLHSVLSFSLLANNELR